MNWNIENAVEVSRSNRNDSPGRLYVTWGDRDGFCTSDAVAKWIAGVSGRAEGRAIAGADHFLMGREREAARYLCDRFQK